MTLPALHHGADIRSITERVNVLIRDHNNPPAPQRLVPAGTVLPFAGSTAPPGFLFCQGQAVSRTDYADLFAVIGTTYGAGNGATTFNLPDLQGRVVAGKEGTATRLTAGGSGVDGATLGSAGGSQTHALTTPQIPAHNHAVTDPGHAHQGAGGGTVVIWNAGNPLGWTSHSGAFHIGHFATTEFAGANIVIQNTGGGGAHQNTQPTIVLNYVIAT